MAPTTAFPSTEIESQSQEGTGLDARMSPSAVFTQHEHFDREGRPFLKDYVGSGKLKGKAVLGTGFDSGIGRAVALLMAREGADLTVIHLPQEREDAESLEEQLREEGRRCLLLALDLMSRENCFRAVEAHIQYHKRLDVLVNNSARQDLCSKFDDIDLDQVEDTYRLNVFAMFAVTKAALPHMKRGGVIINSTSVAAYMGNPDLVDYSSTKGAIGVFTKSLGLQLAPRGIRVCGVAPGIIFTPLQPATGRQHPDTVKAIGVDQAPLQRPGQPSEVASAYVWLASAEAGYVTSTIVHVNGGLDVSS